MSVHRTQLADYREPQRQPQPKASISHWNVSEQTTTVHRPSLVQSGADTATSATLYPSLGMFVMQQHVIGTDFRVWKLGATVTKKQYVWDKFGYWAVGRNWKDL